MQSIHRGSECLLYYYTAALQNLVSKKQKHNKPFTRTVHDVEIITISKTIIHANVKAYAILE